MYSSIKEIGIRFKNLLKAVFRDVLVFLLFFIIYSGIDQGFTMVHKLKVQVIRHLKEKPQKSKKIKVGSGKEMKKIA